jgi:hypothetical protein
MASTTRRLIKHVHEPTVYAVEVDEDGFILAALDVTSEVTSGGLCLHMLSTLPLAGALDDVERLNRERDTFDAYTADCGNVHHLMADLIAAEREHRAASAQTAMAESRFRSLKKDTELKAAKVHDLLGRIADRKPLPLFEGV